MAEPPEAESIQVHVRVRPLNDYERQRGDHECIHIDVDGRTVRFGMNNSLENSAIDASRARHWEARWGDAHDAELAPEANELLATYGYPAKVGAVS